MNDNFITQKPLPTAAEGYTGRGYITIVEIQNYNNQQLKDLILETVRKDKIFVNTEEKNVNDIDNANETEYEPIQKTILNMLRFLKEFSSTKQIDNYGKIIIVNMLNLYIYRNAYNMLSSTNKRKNGGKSKKHHRHSKKTKKRHHKK